MIFVFGSNEQGIHGAGAAKTARDKYGATLYVGFGPQGKSFAIPTCAKPVGTPGYEITKEKLTYYIHCFIFYAQNHPELEFQVTRIGCGLAGWTDEQVAPLFNYAPSNCYFDVKWVNYMESDKRYWGSF